MLTEVDTRKVANAEVSLYMDTDAKVYLVCVEGHEPITCLTRDRALEAWKHPYAYLPLEGSVCPPNGTEGASPSPVSPDTLSSRTAAMLVELRNVLEAMDDSDFHWAVATIGDVVQELGRRRMRNDVPRPYDHDVDGEDVPF